MSSHSSRRSAAARCSSSSRAIRGWRSTRRILSKNNPLADVFYGVDNTFLSRALAGDIFEPYASPALARMPEDLKLDPGNRLLPVDFGYVTINYDRAYFSRERDSAARHPGVT